MDAFTRHDMQSLLHDKCSPCISIYLPATLAGIPAQQNAIRLKNLLRRADRALAEGGINSGAIRHLLEPAQDLLERLDFWESPGDGIALVRSFDVFRVWRLPLDFSEFLWVGDRFYLKLLWPLIDDGTFYVLAVSQNRVRLLSATETGISEIPTEELPKDLSDALHYHAPESMLQVHSGQPALRGKESAVFSGQGGAPDEKKEELLAYFREIDHALKKVLQGQSNPLVFAGVASLFPIYQQANSYPHLVDRPVAGNPDHWKPHELRERCKPLEASLLHRTRRRDIDRYQNAGSQLTSTDVPAIVEAAFAGQVDALFVATDAQVWGRFDKATGHVEAIGVLKENAVDLLDLAATAVHQQGGRVHAAAKADLPNQRPLSALLRYVPSTNDLQVGLA